MTKNLIVISKYYLFEARKLSANLILKIYTHDFQVKVFPLFFREQLKESQAAEIAITSEHFTFPKVSDLKM